MVVSGKGKRSNGKRWIRMDNGISERRGKVDMFAKVRKEADSNRELSSVAEGGVERWWCLCLLGFRL